MVKVRNCKWCNNEFPVKHRNHKYCSENCQREARLEQKRDYKREYDKKYPDLRKDLGFTRIGAQRNESTNAEIKVIKKELHRTFPKMSTPIYREGGTYFKKGIKFTTNLKYTGSHDFASLDDYTNYSINLTTNQNIRKCPECNGNIIIKDDSRAETYCFSCGLVLLGPPIFGVSYPYCGQEPVLQKEDDKMSFDWTEWYKNDEPEIKEPKISTNNTPVDVICQKCYSPYTIPYSEKQTFHCLLCGSLTMGIGVCRPHNYVKDEFEEETEPSGYDLTNNSD